MPRRLKPLIRLEGVQEQAASPAGHAALAASAGTGKTHVLTARVLRLLLTGAAPESILCLTFTKAGAAEMADRIHDRLAYWVRLRENDLKKELDALGEPSDAAALQRARSLFARVLEAPGGGLRILTIHAFAQSLLAGFPAEAGLTPGFRPLEEREEILLIRSTLADLLVRAENQEDRALIADLQAMSLRLGEAGSIDLLRAAARVPEAMRELGSRESIEPKLRHLFDLPLGDIDAAIEAACADDRVDLAGLRRIAALNQGWFTKKGRDRASLCEAWLAAPPAERAAMLQDLHHVWAKKTGEPLSFASGQAPQDPDYPALAEAAFEWCAKLTAMRRTAELAAAIAAGLRAGQAFATAYAESKQAQGFVDFDDLIRLAANLLRTPGIADWVRYKLDQQTDHILVDEAQDTNAAQWSIIEALAGEFFAGRGASGRHRTLFTVGDFKQAIFSFQGTDPSAFEEARAHFARQAQEARDSADSLRKDREDRLPPDFLNLSMDRSFRSSPAVLEVVDRLIGEIGHEALGLPSAPNPHVSHHAGRPGLVTLWQAFVPKEGEEDEGEEGWISDSTRRYATELAKQVKAWLDDPFELASARRPVRPEDILILVRRRGELAGLIVARLHAEGVPVAGLDRLTLSAPLAVQDLLAAARFAVQPLDDLNLASLLVSPLIGWTQDDLFHAAFDRGDTSLWQRLRRRAEQGEGRPIDALESLLAMADFTTPHDFFETILSGPLAGRRRLMERLGPEARDPIEELLSSALQFESAGAPSLGRFLDWFARGDVEIVRDPSAPLDAVRVMTVHGSKGLEAPVVIIADACADPARMGGGTPMAGLPLGKDIVAPVARPRKAERVEPLKSLIKDKERRDREEHWRLLYVAMTRARERLYIGGALGNLKAPPADSWYRAAESALAGLGGAWEDDPVWGKTLRHGGKPGKAAARPPQLELALASPRAPSVPPAWLAAPAPLEERPSRPLAPSAPQEDDAAYPPPDPATRQAAIRGKLLHRLFERLPAVPPAERRARADQWLEQGGEAQDPAFRAALINDACRIIEAEDFQSLFGPDALAEAPVAAVVPGGQVVSGTVDRLLILPDRVLVADFKTGRSVPASPKDAPVSHLRQMAAYRAALSVIFPDRQIEAALLYTAGPVLHRLPADLLAEHAPSAY